MHENPVNDYSYQGKVTGENLYLHLKPPYPHDQWVQCFWQLNVPCGNYSYRSVPDNNIDAIFTLNHTENNFLVPPFHSPAIFNMSGPVSYFGVRFRVLAQHGLTAIPVGEWQGASMNDIFGTRLTGHLYEAIELAESFHDRCNSASAILLANLSYRGIDKRFANFIRYAYHRPSAKLDISDRACAEFALSARHLRRLCQLYLGLSPRNFSRVLRFQNILHLMNTSDTSSAWADCYYDQPHFNREFKLLSGLTPGEFANSSVLYNNASSPT